ncbi:MAG: YbbR-like domain-containing protein [Ignavibacteriae bacterium]|nr:YbbR-like domain-containing protein [Ignavibacteriota bacterium]
MKNRNIPIMLATTLFAILIWFSVSMSEQYRMQISAPLIIQSLPHGTGISSPVPREVQLTFRDTGWRLAKLAWKPGVSWTIDYPTLPRRGLTLRDFSEQLSATLGVQPVSMSPESIYISLDALASKHVRVQPRFTADFRDGYGQVGETLVTPESVMVTGAESLLGHIAEWPTETQEFSQLRQPIDIVVPLNDSLPALVFQPNQVRLQINVQQFAERRFADIRVEFVSAPLNREILLSTPRVEIVVRGGIDQLARINRNSFRAVVDYRTILEDTSGFVQPELTAPSTVHIVKVVPDRLSYVIRKKP